MVSCPSFCWYAGTPNGRQRRRRGLPVENGVCFVCVCVCVCVVLEADGQYTC